MSSLTSSQVFSGSFFLTSFGHVRSPGSHDDPQAALLFISIAANGCLMSWAIDAVSFAIVIRARDARELELRGAQLFLGTLAVGNIDARAEIAPKFNVKRSVRTSVIQFPSVDASIS
jgi:hypothetical protein